MDNYQAMVKLLLIKIKKLSQTDIDEIQMNLKKKVSTRKILRIVCWHLLLVLNLLSVHAGLF